jgi:hypothetical protein
LPPAVRAKALTPFLVMSNLRFGDFIEATAFCIFSSSPLRVLALAVIDCRLLLIPFLAVVCLIWVLYYFFGGFYKGCFTEEEFWDEDD